MCCVCEIYKKILDILYASLADMFENCKQLRYLNLLHYGAGGLPKTIYNLCNLQILKIGVGWLEFPHRICKLINLRHLILDDEGHIEDPRGFGRLINIYVLRAWTIH